MEAKDERDIERKRRRIEGGTGDVTVFQGCGAMTPRLDFIAEV